MYEHYSSHSRSEVLQFNKRLTERLLEVAQEHNYVFDPMEFDHAAIRHRIARFYSKCKEKEKERSLKVVTGRKCQVPKRTESKPVVEEREPLTNA